MTKTLTEQWREGTLPRGAYYVNRLGEVRIYLVTYEDDKNTHEIYEVLAPVPSYSEYQALKDNCEFTHTRLKGTHQKITQLEKKLEIATKALKKYAEEGNWDDYRAYNFCIDDIVLIEKAEFEEKGYELAKKALKEMEGVK